MRNMKKNRHQKLKELVEQYEIETQDELAEKLKEAGFDVQVKNIAWDGIFAALASNQVDVIAASVSITDKRKKAMLFTDPYYDLHQAVVLPLGKEIKDLEELAGKRVGGQIGTTASSIRMKNTGRPP